MIASESIIMSANAFETNNDTITIPKDLFESMVASYREMEQIMSTIEILVDQRAMESIDKSKEDLKNGDFVDCSIDEIDTLLA